MSPFSCAELPLAFKVGYIPGNHYICPIHGYILEDLSRCIFVALPKKSCANEYKHH